MQRYMYRVAEASNRIVDYIRIANKKCSAKRFWIILKSPSADECAELVVFCIAGIPAMKIPVKSILDGKYVMQIAAINIKENQDWKLQINICCDNTIASITKKEEP